MSLERERQLEAEITLLKTTNAQALERARSDSGPVASGGGATLNYPRTY